MANTRQALKSYMGYSIIKVNGWKYSAFNGTISLESNDLRVLKKRIKEADKVNS